MPALRTLAVVVALAVLPACTESKPEPRPTEDPSAAARARLSVLAQATADGEYDATYRFVQRPSNATGTIRIRQVPPQYRIDVTSKGTASFIALENGIISCTVKGRATSCFLVARKGEEVPALFDPGVQRLFRDAVEELAKHPNDYVVTALEPTAFPSPSSTGTTAAPTTAAPKPGASPPTVKLPPPPGICFRVERVSTEPPAADTTAAGFENGTYCFAEEGIATRIEVASGVLELVNVGGEPNSTWFVPPAKVQRLPELQPTRRPTARPTASPTR